MLEQITQLFLLLVFFHFLADFPLQGDYLAKAKNRHTDLGKDHWGLALFAHSFIHAGFVFMVTSSIIVATLELVSHAVIDYLKCENKFGIHVDQALHICLKLIWVTLIYVYGI